MKNSEKGLADVVNGEVKSNESVKTTAKAGISNLDSGNNDHYSKSGDRLDGRDSDSDEESGDSGGEAKSLPTKDGKGKATEKKKKKVSRMRYAYRPWFNVVTQWKVTDLPAPAHLNNRWRKVFVPTLIRYMGTRARPWAWEDRPSIQSVQMIWDAVYGEGMAKHVVTFNDPVHFCVSFYLVVVHAGIHCSGILQATQRLYDWRKAIGYWASQVLDNFFDNDSQFSDISARAEYCAALTDGDDFRFVFEKPFDEKKVCRLLFNITLC